MSNSTALVIPTKDNDGEKLPQPESLLVPAALLLSANSITDDGLMLHARDRRGRVVSTDGHRLFVASFPIEGKAPSWMQSGIFMQGDGLKARIAMIARGREEPLVSITHTKGTPKAVMSDGAESMTFTVNLSTEFTPINYEAVLSQESFVDLDGEGRVGGGQEWRPLGFNSRYLKECGEIARTLNAGMPRDLRKALEIKNGMLIRSFQGAEDRPLVFDFPDWPGAILAIMPIKLSSTRFSKETAQLLAPAMRGSIAALRAHASRQRIRAENATTEAERQDALRQKADFEARAARIVEAAGGVGMLGKSKPEPQPEPVRVTEQEPEPPVDAPREEEQPGPTVKRRKIVVNKAA